MALKVVLDTNIIVSAALSEDGSPAKIFEMLICEEIINYTSDPIITEVRKVVSRPIFLQRLSLVEISFITDNYQRFSKKVEPGKKIDKIKEDPADNKFLECAAAASAGYIITGDMHLLKVKKFREMIILSPAEFIEMIKRTH